MSKMKRLIIGFLCLLVVGVFWSRYGFTNPFVFRFRSDSEMMAHFRENGVKFAGLIEMAKADAKFDNIQYGSNPGLPDERWKAYRAGFDEVQVRGMVSAPDFSGYIFYAESCGTIFSPITEICLENGSKGYVFSAVEIGPQFDSLERLEPAKSGESFVFRKIENNWYLFFRFPD